MISEEGFRPSTPLSNFYLDLGGYSGDQQQGGRGGAETRKAWEFCFGYD